MEPEITGDTCPACGRPFNPFDGKVVPCSMSCLLEELCGQAEQIKAESKEAVAPCESEQSLSENQPPP
jgi:hypothetical protein